MRVADVEVPCWTRFRWWVRPALFLGLKQLALKHGIKFRIGRRGRWRTLDLSGGR